MLCPGSQEFDHWFGDKVDVACRVAWSMLSGVQRQRRSQEERQMVKRHPLQRMEERVANKGIVAVPRQGISYESSKIHSQP